MMGSESPGKSKVSGRDPSDRGSEQVCVSCVMDLTDSLIEFDESGICNQCRDFESIASKIWFPNDEGKRRLETMLEEVREGGKGREYDCILGLSGGLDSSYVALKMHEWGLRPLVVHVDAGWNSELAVANIEKIVKHCNYDLHTYVVDWEEMRDLHLAYLRAGVPNQDVPQDHVFFSTLYHFAIQSRLRTIFSGGNVATEGVYATGSGEWNAMDARNLRAIHRRFGNGRLRSYRTIGFFDYYVRYPLLYRMRTVRPLNYMPYDKSSAIAELESTIGWRAYPRKHGESLFTRFFQNHYLPTKFGYDRRRTHFSALIRSGQMTREEAVRQLEEPLYQPDELESDTAFVAKKLGLTRAELQAMIEGPNRDHLEFPSQARLQSSLQAGKRLYQRVTGRRVRVYS